MTPTTKLRFVERHIQVGAETTAPIATTVRVLQQWWQKQYLEIVNGPVGAGLAPIEGEWRDVPLEKE